MPEFMITLRTEADPDQIGPPRYLTFTTADGPDTQIADPAAWALQIAEGFPVVRRPAGPRMTLGRSGEILFLVHGFNVTHAAAKAFHVQCVQGLAAQGWTGQVVSYDWPSDGLVFAYLPDRSNARAAADALVTSAISLLRDAQADDCTLDVHVLAHSMGAFVTQQAFCWAYQDVPPDWSVGQLMLVAGDVDYSVFSAGAPSANAFVRYAGRLTNYCNRYDKALLVSNAKRLDLAPRVGRVGLPADSPEMMCQVDCSALFTATNPGVLADLSPQATHCFYFAQPAFWRDVVLTLAGGVDRSVIATRSPDATTEVAERYVLDPGGISDGSYQRALSLAAVTPSVGPQRLS